MKFKLSALTLLVLLIAAIPAAAETFRVELGGGLSGDPDGSGIAIVTIEGTTVSYTMTYDDIGTPIGAHIHSGGPDDDGPIVVDLMPNFGASSASGSVTTTQQVIDGIFASPGAHYLNIHTQDRPGGAIRGQLSLVASSPTSLRLVLDGDAEVPGPGDPDGSGLVTIDFFSDSIGYTIQVEDVMNPTAAHIHSGSALVPGPIFVDLQASFESGIAVGDVDVDPATLAMIQENLEDFYVNVHTADYPAGALRAQLAKEWVLPIVGKTQGANNTNFVTDVRLVNFSATDHASIRIDFFPSTLTGLDGPSMSRTVSIPPLSQAVANDIVGNLFGTTGIGAMTFVSSRDLKVIGRVINDLRDQGLGTNGLFLEAPRVDEAATSGTLPFLSNSSPVEIAAGEGFRTNVGFFNPTGEAITLTFNTHRGSDGFAFGTVTTTVQPYQHLQQNIFNLVTGVPAEDQDRDDFYATWSSNGPLFVYAAVTDNRTGDALVID